MPFECHIPAMLMDEDNLPSLVVLNLIYRLEVIGGEHTGRIIHCERPSWMFRLERARKAFLTRLMGKPAFTTLSHGYLSSKYLKWPIYAHRVMYKMFHGTLCPKMIDHENGVLTDNRPDNLRPSNHQHNARNMKKNITNTSGHTGVVWNKDYEMWRAVVKVDNKNVFLGNFDRKADAIKAREEADRLYGFTERHGKI